MQANISVGAKHDRSQYEMITNNLYAVMLRERNTILIKSILNGDRTSCKNTWNGQDARSTRKDFFGGTGFLPVRKFDLKDFSKKSIVMEVML
ncbi:MAG: hypothetical protein EAZ93_19780 [Oscillatoriales cyanobacterium]|uniref:hypothetical protein n=1 Tax=Microcoleus sp. PH2017_16_JOR_D_A TaxID=2798827 RepID=UPI001DE9ECF1|nr:hypothetical protein [Microcoleus sp. PH2017_16_JOR_D_A]MCC3493175.1 hypothetical protein [Microcoleus sp. PH2017_16_JOR_D_A]TAE21696.1 MAG: hypothetical protein EAZ93_19780 [Oscillatoriales cyanobacterium]